MTDTASAPPPPAQDPAAILRSRNFVVLLVFAAVVGIIVSLIGWGFLELIHQIQLGVFQDIPNDLGYNTLPWWYPLPVLLIAGVPVAFAIARLPGNGGHVPAHGLQVGSTEPNMVPGIALAALATLGLGLVLGPEAPLIAIGGGIAVFIVQRAKKDAPAQLVLVLGAAGAFAAISVIFGSPIVSAILVIEAAGLGGAILPLILIPGLIAAGIGSLVFIGMANWTGLSTSAYSLVPLHLAPLDHVTWEEIGWTILLGVAAALVTWPVRQIGLRAAKLVPRRPFVVIPLAGLLVAGTAVLFFEITGKSMNLVLFSGQDALPGLVDNASTYTVGVLSMILLWKGIAWSVSLGTYRGGPTFPAIFLGAAGGIAASHLPGLPATPAIAVGMGVMVVAFLKLPLSAIVIATALTFSGGPGVVPLIIVGVVAAYLMTLALEGRLGTGTDGVKPDAAPAPVPSSADAAP
jgi:H+/Cl- antiporter ClcA